MAEYDDAWVRGVFCVVAELNGAYAFVGVGVQVLVAGPDTTC